MPPAVNLYGVIRLVNLIAPHMIARRSGVILPIGSVVGDVSTPWTGVYNLSKSALHAYADTLAVELRPFDVHVCLVTPGAVTSNFGQKQTASIQLAKGSLFEACRDDIYTRANRGQGA
jgi:short-subunit dehydrogenase